MSFVSRSLIRRLDEGAGVPAIEELGILVEALAAAEPRSAVEGGGGET
jgi:hypothetical protein